MQKLKLIVDFHTDIDFKLGKLRVGGLRMFSARVRAGEIGGRLEDRMTDDTEDTRSSAVCLKNLITRAK